MDVIASKKLKYLIEVIRLLIYPNFLIGESEIFKFMALIDLYCDIMDINYETLANNYIKGIITYYSNISNAFFKYDLNTLTKYIIPECDMQYEENISDVLRDYFTSSHYVLKQTMENILFPPNNDIRKVTEIIAGKKIFPLNLNAVIELAPWDFICKYYEKLFSNHHFIKELSSETIIITNPFNDVKCVIPKNLFETYCKFNTLTKDFKYLNSFIIPILFNQSSSDFFVKCIIEGKVLPFDGITHQDFFEFKNLISYLDINLNNFHS